MFAERGKRSVLEGLQVHVSTCPILLQRPLTDYASSAEMNFDIAENFSVDGIQAGFSAQVAV